MEDVVDLVVDLLYDHYGCHDHYPSLQQITQE